MYGGGYIVELNNKVCLAAKNKHGDGRGGGGLHSGVKTMNRTHGSLSHCL